MTTSLNIVRAVPPGKILTVIEKSLRNWKVIVVHHTAAKYKNNKRQAFKIEEQHRYDNEWRHGMGYHLFIEGDGAVFYGERWRTQHHGAHARLRNHYLGICLAGHFGKQEPTEQQLRAFRKIVRQFKSKLRIIPHQGLDVSATKCPGKNIDFKFLFNNIDKV